LNEVFIASGIERIRSIPAIGIKVMRVSAWLI
jgi:hypothetical protein